jgi:purine-binding chemotaxis protein CheW
MDLLDIRKKAKEAKAAKEAEAKGASAPEPEAPPVPEPAPAKEIALKKVKRRHGKAAGRVVSIAEAAQAVEEAAMEGSEGAEVPAATAQENAVAEVGGAHVEEEMSAAAAQAVESSGKVELLAFMLGDEEYALKMEEAREIIRWRKPAKVPRAPEYIIGIISLRGVILPVFDVKKRLGLGELDPSRHTRIIVVSEGGSLSGMVVDRITGVTAVPEREMESAPAVIDGNEAEYIEGVGRAGERLLILIRASRALSA